MLDLTQCKSIYNQAFNDDAEFTDKLFYTCSKHCKSLEKNGETVSMLFVLPCIITINDKHYKSGYIYGAATKIGYRNHGYMKQLLYNILTTTKDILILKPANDSLISFYNQCGFTCFSATKQVNSQKFLTPIDEYKDLCGSTENINKQFTAMYYSKETLDLKNMSFPYTME